MKTYKIGRLLNAVILSCALWAALVGSTARGAAYSDQATAELGALFGQDPMFNAVVKVSVYTDLLNGIGYGGSGTVIGNGEWVLTAGHVITTASSIDQIKIKIGPNANSPDGVAVADSWYVYPGYTGGAGLGVDLALIHIATPIGSITPATLYSGTQSSLTGVMASMAGYGTIGLAGQGLQTYNGLRYGGQNTIGEVYYPSVDPQYLVTRFDAPNSGVAAALEWQGTPGDSGGPWMVQVGGVWEVAAVSSGVNHDPSFSFGDVTFANNVFDYLGWIQSYTSVPEPTTGAVLVLGIACLLGRGKRR